MNDRTTTAGLRCAKCRYDLSGSDMAGACPECAHPVALSWDRANDALDKAVLRFRRRWRLLAIVTESLGWFAGVSAILGIIAILLFRAYAEPGGPLPGWMNGIGMALFIGVVLVSVVGSLLWWIEWLLLSFPASAALWPGLSRIAKGAMMALIALPAVVIVARIVLFAVQWDVHYVLWMGMAQTLLTYVSSLVLIAYTTRLAVVVRGARDVPLFTHPLALLAVVVALVSIGVTALDWLALRARDDSAIELDAMRSLTESLRSMMRPLAMATLYIAWGYAMRRITAALPDTAQGYRERLGLSGSPLPVPAD